MVVQVLLYFFVGLNLLLGALITSSVYPVVGILVFVFSFIMLTVGRESHFGTLFIDFQLKYLFEHSDKEFYQDKRFQMSIACLILSLEIGAIITFIVHTIATLILTIVLFLIICSSSDDSVGIIDLESLWNFSHFVVKIAQFIQITIFIIAEYVAKIELFILLLRN